MSGVVTLVVMMICGAVLVVTGVFMLVGAAWSVIAAGVFMFAAAFTLRRGLTDNG